MLYITILVLCHVPWVQRHLSWRMVLAVFVVDIVIAK